MKKKKRLDLDVNIHLSNTIIVEKTLGMHTDQKFSRQLDLIGALATSEEIRQKNAQAGRRERNNWTKGDKR